MREEYRSMPGLAGLRAQEEARFLTDPRVQTRWEIPEEVIIKVALSGRSQQDLALSPQFPSSLEGFQRAACEVIEAGVSGIHFDYGSLPILEQAPQSGILDLYREVIEPLKERYGRRFVVDCNILRGGTFLENLSPVTSGLAEVACINPAYPARWVQAAAEVCREYGAKPEIVIHGPGQIELAQRLLISKDILEKPYCWILLLGLPFERRSQAGYCSFMPGPRAMVENLLLLVNRIKEIEEDSVILVCASGRACHYLTTLAMLLGLHVRVGTEDTVWRYPHKDEIVESNAQMVETAVQMAQLLGRRVATAEEYRDILGLRR